MVMLLLLDVSSPFVLLCIGHPTATGAVIRSEYSNHFEPLDPRYPTARTPEALKHSCPWIDHLLTRSATVPGKNAFVSSHFGDHPQLRGAKQSSPGVVPLGLVRPPSPFLMSDAVSYAITRPGKAVARCPDEAVRRHE